jgi:hypothetical protein
MIIATSGALENKAAAVMAPIAAGLLWQVQTQRWPLLDF